MDKSDALREWGEYDFGREVPNCPGRAVVMFGDRWNGPSHMTQEALRKLAPDFPSVVVGVVNMSDAPDLSASFRVYQIPTVVVFEAGREVRRLVGWQHDWRAVLGGETSS